MTLEAARDKVAALMPPSAEPPAPEQIPFSPRAKGTLEAALRQALGFKDTTIETEHILLALLIERDGRTASVLASLACPPDLLRAMVLEERGTHHHAGPHGRRRRAARPGRGLRRRRARARGARHHAGRAARGRRARPQRLVTRPARGGT